MINSEPIVFIDLNLEFIYWRRCSRLISTSVPKEDLPLLGYGGSLVELHKLV